ncbi:MAG: hypothetical protein M3268_01025 [Acidobacteriota bacterium]|nr:hypothetical protein [Acidobacteriota bacterium]
MKLALTICLCLICAAASAQIATDRAAPPSVTVLKHGRSMEMRHVTPDWDDSDPDVPAPVAYFRAMRPVSIYTVKIENTGAKKIAGLVWDYVYIRQSDGQELARVHLRSRASVAVGKTGTVTGMTLAVPRGPRTVSVDELKRGDDRRFRDDVEIRCVLYKDGSWWRQPGTPDGACETKKSSK